MGTIYLTGHQTQIIIVSCTAACFEFALGRPALDYVAVAIDCNWKTRFGSDVGCTP